MKTPIRFILAVALVLLGFIRPNARAVVPPPDGGYPNFTTAEGQNALLHLSTGVANTAIGWFSIATVTDGDFNTGVGAGTLALNTADENTATGAGALLLNTTGIGNTATGAFALLHNDTGNGNTATGLNALVSNTNGGFNTATGDAALMSNTTGTDNTAIGAGALEFNTGSENTAIGSGALLFNSAGTHNTAAGFQALLNNTAADGNTAYGYQALLSNTGSAVTASFNTAVGYRALTNQTSGTGNIALGASAGDQITTGNNNIDIGNFGQFSDSDTIRIGDVQAATFIAGIRGVTTGMANAIPVLIDSLDQLGTMSSSRRFKKDIKPMDKTSEAILALTPVTFHYKNDNTGLQQFGLIAEDVAEVNPDLVVRDKNGEIYTVRYDALNAMLLNEFLKEHRTVQQQGATIAELKQEIANLTAIVKEQATQLQTVSTQVQAIRSVPQLIVNDR